MHQVPSSVRLVARGKADWSDRIAYQPETDYRSGAGVLQFAQPGGSYSGLPGQLPAGIQVAHKEGDMTGVSNDVGIVFTSRPYILCVLSRGQRDTEAGFKRIADISRLVYDYQERVYGGNLEA